LRRRKHLTQELGKMDSRNQKSLAQTTNEEGKVPSGGISQRKKVHGPARDLRAEGFTEGPVPEKTRADWEVRRRECRKEP